MVKKLKKQFETPNEGWSEERMQREEELIDQFGLKNKKEVYKAESQLRSLRRQARNLVAEEDEEEEDEEPEAEEVDEEEAEEDAAEGLGDLFG